MCRGTLQSLHKCLVLPDEPVQNDEKVDVPVRFIDYCVPKRLVEKEIERILRLAVLLPLR